MFKFDCLVISILYKDVLYKDFTMKLQQKYTFITTILILIYTFEIIFIDHKNTNGVNKECVNNFIIYSMQVHIVQINKS